MARPGIRPAEGLPMYLGLPCPAAGPPIFACLPWGKTASQLGGLG